MSKQLAMLVPKTLVPTGEGAGGFAKLRQCDVAHALAGLPHGAAALLRAMYADDQGEANLRDLYLWAWQEAIGMAADRQWAVPKGRELLRALSARAVEELVCPQAGYCPKCRGTGRVRGCRRNPTGACAACDKTGRSSPTDAQIAVSLALTESEWRTVWAARYAQIVDRLRGWHDDGLAHVMGRLSDQQ